MGVERVNHRFNEIVLVSPDGQSKYEISVKDDNTTPSASEIAAAPLNKVWLKSDAVAGGNMGWVKTGASTVKEWGAISA